ncbi:phosphopantetheine-binding protein [Streptomyces palmae]|uniref:Acyl carrier protein n=1 Tax=Streptomyces palmae TaxID=1701085 RepID=A0A4Z0HHV9_9ACTN|nr:phosphopantetheine-binding protein [Streptomyces palmae]TGB16992.1 acyl carrier protein [Streptomyces palmae]
MTTTEGITEAIRTHILAEYLPGTPREELETSYDLLDNGVVTSLDLLALISWVEQRFQVPIDEVEISPDHFRSVDAMSEFVKRTTGK